MSAAPQDTLRLIPSVDAILHEVAGQPWSQTIPRTLWSETAKTVIGTWRGRLLAGEVNPALDLALPPQFNVVARR